MMLTAVEGQILLASATKVRLSGPPVIVTFKLSAWLTHCEMGFFAVTVKSRDWYSGMELVVAC